MSVYRDYPNVKLPKDENVRIWRYMDFTRFMSLLYKRSLFFPSIKLLKLNDPYEGALPKSTSFQLSNLDSLTPLIGDESFVKMLRFLVDSGNFAKTRNLMDESLVVNCWHLNVFESVAMWKLYSSYDAGIAIQSTYKKLTESFVEGELSPKTPNGNYVGVSASEIIYIDHATDEIPLNRVLLPYLCKNKSFEHEHELRVFSLVPVVAGSVNNSDFIRILGNAASDFDRYKGIYFPVDLNVLIEQVWVAPDAPEWLKDAVESAMNKYGLQVPIKQSDLKNVSS